MIPEADFKSVLLSNADWLLNYLRNQIPPRFKVTIPPEELLQDVWAAAIRSAQEIPRDQRSIERWLQTIAKNKLIDAIRNARSLKRGGLASQLLFRTTEVSGFFSRLMADSPTPSREMSIKELESAIRLALASLPDMEREAVQLRFIEGRSREQVALALQKTGPAVNSLLFRGLRMLKAELKSAARFFSDADSVHGTSLEGHA